MTFDDLEDIFTESFNKTLGTVTANSFGRRTLVRKLARKLSDHFDATMWPDSKEEVLVYVREALKKYS